MYGLGSGGLLEICALSERTFCCIFLLRAVCLACHCTRSGIAQICCELLAAFSCIVWKAQWTNSTFWLDFVCAEPKRTRGPLTTQAMRAKTAPPSHWHSFFAIWRHSAGQIRLTKCCLGRVPMSERCARTTCGRTRWLVCRWRRLAPRVQGLMVLQYQKLTTNLCNPRSCEMTSETTCSQKKRCSRKAEFVRCACHTMYENAARSSQQICAIPDRVQ